MVSREEVTGWRKILMRTITEIISSPRDCSGHKNFQGNQEQPKTNPGRERSKVLIVTGSPRGGVLLSERQKQYNSNRKRRPRDSKG